MLNEVLRFPRQYIVQVRQMIHWKRTALIICFCFDTYFSTWKLARGNLGRIKSYMYNVLITIYMGCCPCHVR